MRELQAQIIREMGVKPNMTGRAGTRRSGAPHPVHLRLPEATGSRGLVLGISGGIRLHSGGSPLPAGGRPPQRAWPHHRVRGGAPALPCAKTTKRTRREAPRFIQPTRSLTFNIAEAKRTVSTPPSVAATGEQISDFNKG